MEQRYLWFEDFAPGQTYEVGTVTAEEAELLEFAARYDPQPFHVDPEAAKDSVFDGLIASGWWTGSAFMRLYVDALLSHAASLGSPGVSELRWLRPVRPGDVLSGSFTVQDVAPSERNPARGTVFFLSRMVNQDGVEVLSMTGRGLFGRRPAAAAGAADNGPTVTPT